LGEVPVRPWGRERGAGSLTSFGKRPLEFLSAEAQVAQLASGSGRVIAGAGSATVLRDMPRLASQYGGAMCQWSKVSSTTKTLYNGVKIETHAYANRALGIVTEMKTKFINLVQ
jgi:hypothetical protein